MVDLGYVIVERCIIDFSVPTGVAELFDLC